jgi:fluoroacetyl-CoA thioesterase
VKRGLVVGDRRTVEFVVDETMVAAFEGKVIHKVLSTFYLVYYSELAARKLIEPFLDDGEEAAGTEVCVKHVAPTGIGERVVVTAALNRLENRTIVCDISATNSKGQILTGRQTQVLVGKGSLDPR